MNVVVAEDSTTGPEEVVEPLDLPEEFGRVLGHTGKEVEIMHRVVLAVGPERDQFTSLACLQPVEEFSSPWAVAAHQADADLEFLLVGFRRQIDDPPGARPIDCNRLLHEDMEAFLDRILKMRRPERGRGGEDRDVAGPKGVNCLFVGFKADEHPLVRHIDPVRMLGPKVPPDDLGPPLHDVSKGHELQRRLNDCQGIGRRTTPSATTADQGNLNRIATGCVGIRRRCTSQQTREGRHGRGSGRTCFEKAAASAVTDWWVVRHETALRKWNGSQTKACDSFRSFKGTILVARSATKAAKTIKKFLFLRLAC